MKYKIVIKEAFDVTRVNPPTDLKKVSWSVPESQLDQEWSNTGIYGGKPEDYVIEEEIAKDYGLTIVKSISVNKTAFSNVYLVEPDNIRQFGNQKYVVMKLSRNAKEFEPYNKIKNIRRQMLTSSDNEDKEAAKFLPIIYVAEKISWIPYNSIIIMEKLKEVPIEVAERLSLSPWNNATTLIELLKDEEFIVKLFNTSFRKLPKISALLNKNENWQEKIKSIKDKVIYDVLSGKKIEFSLNSRRLMDVYDNLEFNFVRTRSKSKEILNKQKKDIELAENEIFRIIGIIFYHFTNQISLSPLTEELILKFVNIMINELKTGVPIAPVSYHYPSKTNVDISTYETLGPATQNFENAIARLEKYGIERKDLHGKNYLIRDNGQIVISDPGLFVIK